VLLVLKAFDLKDFEPVLHMGWVTTSSGEQGGSKWLTSKDAMRIDRN